MKLVRKEGAEPKRKKNIATCAPIPINLKKPANKMVQELIDAEIIYEITTPTEFCSPGRFISKKDADKARLVVDYRSINGVLERPAFIFMTTYEVKSSIK